MMETTAREHPTVLALPVNAEDVACCLLLRDQERDMSQNTKKAGQGNSGAAGGSKKGGSKSKGQGTGTKKGTQGHGGGQGRSAGN
jgi:hypothetical protein